MANEDKRKGGKTERGGGGGEGEGERDNENAHNESETSWRGGTKKEQKRRKRPAGGRADGGGVFLSFSSICTFVVFHLRQMCFAY